MPPSKKLSRAEKKAVLMQRAEALIEQMLEWTDTTTQPNLTQIEDMALDLRQQFGQALSESAIASQENVAPLQLPACPQCGKPMRPKDQKTKRVVARVGTLKLERSYFYCPAFSPWINNWACGAVNAVNKWPAKPSGCMGTRVGPSRWKRCTV